MDVHSTIDQILALVENARSMPMSGSCVVNRGGDLGLSHQAGPLGLGRLDDATGLRASVFDDPPGLLPTVSDDRLPTLEHPAGVLQLGGQLLPQIADQLHQLAAVHHEGARHRHRPSVLDPVSYTHLTLPTNREV